MHVHWKGCIVGCPDFSIITNFRWSSTVNTTQTNHNMLCTAYTINYLSEVFCSFEQSTTSQLSSKLRGRWLDLYVQAWLRGPWEVTPLPSGNFQILSQSNYFTCTPSAYQQGWQDQRHQNFTRYVRSKKLCQAVPQDQRWRLDTISQNNICPWNQGSVISLFHIPLSIVPINTICWLSSLEPSASKCILPSQLPLSNCHTFSIS